MTRCTHNTVIQAIRAHWAAHGGKYPTKISLTPAHHDELIELQTIGRAGRPPEDPLTFMGCKVERNEGAGPTLVSPDGTTVPLDL